MVKIGKQNALGRGLRALIKDKSEEKPTNKEELKNERHARNMEFYGSLLKKYVRSGAEDDRIDQMLEDVRKHMGVSREEHKNLLSTLRKRESSKVHSDTDIEKAQSEIKEELSQIYDRIGKKKRKKSRFSKIEGRKLDKDVQDAIPLPDKQANKKSKVAKVIRRRLVARDLDERAGILTGPGDTSKGKIQWMEEDDKPIKMPGPKKGLEDNEEAIKVTAPQEGLDDNQEPIKVSAPQEGLEDVSDPVILGSSSEETNVKETNDEDLPTQIDESSGPTIEAPPSKISPKEEMVFESVNESMENIAEKDHTEQDEIVEPEAQTETGEEIRSDENEYIPADRSVEEIETEPDIDDMEEMEELEEDQKRLAELEDSLLSMKMLMEEEKIDDAYSMGERLLEKDNENINVLNEMGVILYHQGKMNEALALYRGILDKEPDTVETLINYATLLSLNGELDNSLECLDKAVKKDPYSEDAWNNKAVVLTSAGRLREALECLDEALRINEKSPATWMNTGIILEKMGEIGPALECYQNLLEIDPSNEVALLGIDYCRSKLER